MTLESQVGQVNSDSQEWVLIPPRFPLVGEKQLQTTLSFLAPEELRLEKAWLMAPSQALFLPEGRAFSILPFKEK